MRERRADYSDRAAARVDRGLMRRSVHASRETGYDGEIVLDQLTHQPSRARQALLARLAGTDDGDAARLRQIPPALIVDQLDRVRRIAQLLRIFAGAMHANAKAVDMRRAKAFAHEIGIFARLLRRHEIRWQMHQAAPRTFPTSS